MDHLDSLAIWMVGVWLVVHGIVAGALHVARHRSRWQQAITSPRACTYAAATVFGLCLILIKALGQRALPAQFVVLGVLGFVLMVNCVVAFRLPDSRLHPAPPVSPDWLRFQGTAYEAYIAPHGGLVSLRAQGQEFLEPHLTMPGGAFIYQGSPLELPVVTRLGDSAAVAERDSASMHYEFLPNAITVTVRNASVAPMQYVVWFHHLVRPVLDGNVGLVPPLVAFEVDDCSCVSGHAKVRISGKGRLSRPPSGRAKMWAADIAPGETRTVVLEIGVTSDEEDLAAESWEALYPSLRRAG